MFIRSWKVSTKNTPSFLVLMLWMLSFLGPVVFGQTSEDPEQNLRMLMELEQEEVPAGSSVQKFFGSFDVETEQVYENVLQGGTFTVPVKELSKILDEKKLKQAFHDARFSFAEEDKSKTSSSNTAGASNMKRINAAPRDSYLFFAGVNPSERGTFKEEKVEGKKTFESTFQPSSRNISKEPEITQVGFRYDPDKRIFGRMDLCIIEQDLVRLLYGEIRGINREDIERIGWAWLVRNRTEEEDELPRDFGDNIQEVARSGEFGGWNRNKELVRKDLSGDEHEFDRKMYDRITSKIIPKVLEGCTGGFVEDPTDGALFGISVSDTGAKNLLKAFDNDRTISARKLDLPNTIDPDTGNNILTDEVEWQAVLLNKRSEFEDVDDINPPSVFFRVKNGNEPTVRFNIKQDDIQ